MKQEYSEQHQAYEAALANFRTAETLFSQKQAEHIAALERENRIRTSLTEAETQAAAAKAGWDDAFRASDGVLGSGLKPLRSALREANDLVDDYRKLVIEAEQQAALTKPEAEMAAVTMRTAQQLALRVFAEMEMRVAIADSGPKLARAFRLFERAMFIDDWNVRRVSPEVDTMSKFTEAVASEIKDVSPESLDLPRDLVQRADIAPLRWEDISLARIARDRKLAAAAGDSSRT